MVKDIFFDLQRFADEEPIVETTGETDGDTPVLLTATATNEASTTTASSVDERDSNGEDQIVNPDDSPKRDDHIDTIRGTLGDYDGDGLVDDGFFWWNKTDSAGNRVHRFRGDRLDTYNAIDYLDVNAINPVHLVPASVRGSATSVYDTVRPSIYLDGTQYDYSFAFINERDDYDQNNPYVQYEPYDWKVFLQGADNVVRGDLIADDYFGSYGLDGTATIRVYQTKEFSEILNGQDQTFIKYAANYKDEIDVPDSESVTGDTLDHYIDVEIKAPGFDSHAFTYTMSDVDSVKVGLADVNDTLVFNNSTDTEQRIYTANYDSDQEGNIIAKTVSIAAENVSIGTAYNTDEYATIGTFDFYDGNATLTNDNLDVNVAVKEGTRVRVTDNRLTTSDERYYDDWKFDTKSNRDVVSLTAAHADFKTDPSNDVTGYNASDIIKVENYTDKATLISTDGLDNTVTLKPNKDSADTYVWQQITGDLRVIQFDSKGNATVNNTNNGSVIDYNGNNELGDVIVRGQAGLEVQFDSITAAGVVVNGHKNGTEGATITAATLQTFADDDDDLLKLSTDTTNLADPFSSKVLVEDPLVTASRNNTIPEEVGYPLTSSENPIEVNITGNVAPRDNISVELDEIGIKSITVNTGDEDAPIKVAGDKQFEVKDGRRGSGVSKTFGVTTEANDVTFAVRDVVLLSPDDMYDEESLRTKNSTLADRVEVSQDWNDLGVADPRKNITNVTDKNYTVGIRDKDYVIKDALVVRVNPNEENQAYTVTGGDAVFDIEDITAGANAVFSINSAAVDLHNNNTVKVDNDDYIVTADSSKSGVDTITGLKANDAVSVSGDSDGYTAIFEKATAEQVANDEIVTYAVNGANVSVKAKFVAEHAVTIIADSGNNVTVQGIEGYEFTNTQDNNKETDKDNEEKYLNKAEKTVVTVAGGAVYHFKNDRDRNEVTLSSGATAEVTLSSSGDVSVNETVSDVIEDNAKTRIEADGTKWNDIATVGASTINSDLQDTVVSHHAKVYEDFYDLNSSNVSSNAVAGYDNEDAEGKDGASNINISGANVKGDPAAIGDATHVTLSGDNSVGQRPINIQSNESANVKDVTVNLTNSDAPSTVSVGTRGDVTASHNIQLSNSSNETNPSYAYIGKYATGENVLQAGGAAMLRHDGTSRNTLLGGSGNDTIRGDVNDIVSGGGGVDFFYDLSGYAVDYKVDEGNGIGDIIIASRLRDLNEVTLANIRGSGNQIGFGNGENLLTLGSIDPIQTVHVKVAVMDDDGNVKDGVRDVVLANDNVLVDATPAGTNGALIIANAVRGDGVHAVVGSAGQDTIYVGSNDTVNGMGGNDSIAIDANSFGVVVGISEGRDSVSGWNFGFDRSLGATMLDAGGAQVRGRVYEDRLLISLEGAEAEMSFEDTKVGGTRHGQYNVLVGETKFTAIRNGDSYPNGYAEVLNNDELADFYLAEREGILVFTKGVTADLGEVNLASEKYEYIRDLYLSNNSKAVVLGSADRETVHLADAFYGGGDASVGANKFVSLGGGNDVIFSGGDGYGIAANVFMFGAGDGRDTIHSFGHYLGVDVDPDKQQADVIALQTYNGLKAEVDEFGYTRVEFALGGTAAGENEYALIYEAPGTFDYNNNRYLVAIGDSGPKVAKIGYSTFANEFTFDKEVSYYVGSSGESRDTLVVRNISENVEIYLDSSQDVNGDGVKEYYRGIGVVNASEETNTNISIKGSAADNMLIAGNDGTRNFLWGGAGDNTLVGGTGQDYFLYFKESNAWTEGADPTAEGNHDRVVNYNENQDFNILGDITIDDINYEAMAQVGGNYGITENSVTVCFKNGGSMTVDVTAQNEKVQFYMSDGHGGAAIYSALRSTGSWVREA